MSVTRKVTAIIAGSLFMLGAVAGPAQAKDNTTINDGLVNVTVGDITIQDVTVEDTLDANAIVNVVATVCPLVDADVLLLAQQVDATGKKEIVCKTDSGAVKIVNNK